MYSNSIYNVDLSDTAAKKPEKFDVISDYVTICSNDDHEQF